MDSNSDNGSELVRKTRRTMRDARRILKPTWLNSWRWSTPSFTEALDWLMAHPAQLHKGEYISDLPGKEVWHLQLPEAFGSTQIVFRKTDGYKMPFGSRLGKSPSYCEALNFAAFSALGILTPEVLACGESRELGILRSSFIITRFLKHSYNGSTLMPEGQLRENDGLRMGFCRNLMKYLAKMHLAGFSNAGFHPRKVLFPKKSFEKNPQLFWVDAETCVHTNGKNMYNVIPLDLVHIFVSLRLSTKEIQELCKVYLEYNPHCGHTPRTLWDAMAKIPIGS